MPPTPVDSQPGCPAYDGYLVGVVGNYDNILV